MHVDVHAWNCVILLEVKNKLYAGTEIHVDVYAWNCVILLDVKNKLYAGTEMHVDVQDWDCVILLDFKNKLYVGTEMMLMSLLEFWDGDWLQHDFVVSAENQSSLPNCVVRNELILAVELCCSQRISVRCRIVFSTTN